MTRAIAEDLLEILADPETHEPLTVATEAQLEALRQAIASGSAARADGQPVPTPFDAALLSQGGKVAYLVRDGIANFLVDERVELGSPL